MNEETKDSIDRVAPFIQESFEYMSNIIKKIKDEDLETFSYMLARRSLEVLIIGSISNGLFVGEEERMVLNELLDEAINCALLQKQEIYNRRNKK